MVGGDPCYHLFASLLTPQLAWGLVVKTKGLSNGLEISFVIQITLKKL